MPLPVKNSCGPSNYFGGFNQTLFLGCSVVSFSVSGGWNEQKSELTVQLIKDSCPGNKKYYNRSLSQQTWSGADPGFIGESNPILGAPCYFRVGNFEYSGIIQDWTKNDIRDLNFGLPVKSDNKNTNTYTVKLEDPRELLANTQIITNEYAGFTTGLDNVVNVYGFMEATQEGCPPVTQGVDGTIFGAPAAGFGGADVDDNGMPWSKILLGTQVLLGGTTTFGALPGVFSNGYVSFKGISNTGYSGVSGITSGMGIIDQNAAYEAHYVVDLTSLPVVPNSVRMNGSSFSLLDLISQVCEIAGYDYYIELIPVPYTFGWTNTVIDTQNIAKFIKVHTVNRESQPTFGAIEEFISLQSSSVGSPGSKSNDVGYELRNETTNQLVIGGQKQNVFDTDNLVFDDPEGDGQPPNPEADDMMVPHFGLDANGNAIIPTRDADDFWEFEANVIALNEELAEYGHAFAVNVVTINEKELQAAQVGLDSWILYSQAEQTDIAIELGNFNTIFNVEHLKNLLDLAANQVLPRDVLKLGNDIFKLNDNVADNKRRAIQAAFDFVATIANDYYGIKYQVRVPNTCGYIPTSQDGTIVGWGGKIKTSEVPSDGGWSEETPLLGLGNPSAAMDFFRLDDGRIGNYVKYLNIDELELSELDPSTFIIDDINNIAWVKAQNDEEYVYIDKENLISPRIVLSLPAPMPFLEKENNNNVFGLVKILELVGENAKAVKLQQIMEEHPGSVSLRIPNQKTYVMPDGAAVAVKSNALRYGPWGSSTVAGKANVRTEEGLVPWEYGSYANMNIAGNALAVEGVTYMQVGERGSIVVPGYPTIPLGAELLSASVANGYSTTGPYNGTGGVNLFENRTVTVTTTGGVGQRVSTTFSIWGGTYGPNITDINCGVSDAGIETTYGMRTYTPKFGRFSKYNAEGIKKIGQNQMKIAKELRLREAGKERLARLIDLNKKAKAKKDLGAEPAAQTPHELLIGMSLPWGNFRRIGITSSPVKEFGADASNWGKKAFMSWDGLIMPVSMNGNGNLPRYITKSASCLESHPKASIPPIDKVGEAGSFNQYNATIDIDYLNPFSNPSGYSRSSVSTNRSDTPSIGHHIDILGRAGISGSAPPASSISIPVQGFLDTDTQAGGDYKNDYRMFALRGPILMQSWGYDTNGFPVPNKADIESVASGGSFAIENLENKFLDDWLRKPHTWPVAPIDLRLDRDRGVWVSPPAYSIIRGQLKDDLQPYGSSVATYVDGPTLYDNEGNSFTGEFIIYDVVGACLSSGDYFLADYDTQNCKYNIINQNNIFNVAHSGNVKLELPVGARVSGIEGTHGLWLGNGLYVTETDGSNCTNLRLDVCLGTGLEFDNHGCITLIQETGTGCLSNWAGVDMDRLPIASGGGIQYVVGIDDNGCFVRIPVQECE